MNLRCFPVLFFATAACTVTAQKNNATITPVDSGWAANSVNTVIFRKNSLVTHNGIQFTAFYDKDGFVVTGKRKTGAAEWQLQRTAYRGNVKDAHNTISIMADGDGYLHIAWDHHNNPLNYCKSKEPYSLELTEKLPMTGLNERNVSYPEFYRLPAGDLLFLYRDGQSGNGNLAITRYDVKTKKWWRVHPGLIDGEGKRNAYWQAFVDGRGMIHISWVWRESPDVASNHDLCYARSADGGKTWTSSTGNPYQLPITAATAEYACRIPPKSELINQASMYADAFGNPFIATYWKEAGDGVPQYHLVYKKNGQWENQSLGFRKTPFSLSGAGTKRIPVSRPQVIAWRSHRQLHAALIFRDEERGSKVSIAVCRDIKKGGWQVTDLMEEPVGSWEPSYDTELWKQKRVLNLFIQKTEQADAEGISGLPPQMIKVLQWTPER